PNLLTLFQQSPWEFYGSNDASTFIGGIAADYIFGDYGDDVLIGNQGDDTLDGGFRDTTDFFGNGNPDFDTVNYSAEGGTLGVVVNLDAGLALDTYGATDTLLNIESVIGTSRADNILGGADGEQFQGRAGNDTINGGGGNDEVRYDQEGGPQAIVVNLATGVATDSFGNTDSLSGIERIRATSRGDTLIGDAGDNRFRGLGGADTIDGGDGIDAVDYRRDENYNGFSAVRVNLSAGFARDGFNAVDLLSNIENVFTTNFDDRVIGNAAANLIIMFDGNDYASGLAGNDTLQGNEGNDILLGGDDNDSLIGGDGADYLTGGAGSDVLDGGFGYDFVWYDNAASGVTARLDFTGGNTGEAAGDSYVGVEGLVGSIFNDFLVGDAGANYIDALSGDDFIAGVDGDDRLFGNDGNDNFWGGLGADAINGGDGFDIARYDFAAAGVTVRLDFAGFNTGEATGDTFLSIEGVYGSTLDDVLVGSSAGDVLAGLDGVDYLLGQGGDDFLLGGGGIDLFAYSTTGYGNDIITDFATTAAAGANHDYIDILGLPLAAFSISQSGANTVITTNHGTITLQNINSATLQSSDFLF
nr:hypothetical protein [Hyphomonas sp.]